MTLEATRRDYMDWVRFVWSRAQHRVHGHGRSLQFAQKASKLLDSPAKYVKFIILCLRPCHWSLDYLVQIIPPMHNILILLYLPLSYFVKSIPKFVISIFL
jgi:hypothetical protein